MVIVISHNGVALDIVREFTELFGCWLRFSCYCFSLIDLDRFLCYFPIKCVMLYWAVKFGGVWPPSNVATCVRSLLNWAFCILEDMTCGSCWSSSREGDLTTWFQEGFSFFSYLKQFGSMDAFPLISFFSSDILDNNSSIHFILFNFLFNFFSQLDKDTSSFFRELHMHMTLLVSWKWKHIKGVVCH